jgi:hypothetical protein
VPRAPAEELFTSFARRVTDPVRDVKYEAARMKIAHGAFLPSRIWRDTGVWTDSLGSRRTLLIGGRFDELYHMEAVATVPSIHRLSDARHAIHLTRLSKEEYAWDTDVAFGIGSVRATEIGAFSAALIASAEGRTERQIREDYAAAAPATGQLFKVDSITTAQLPDHSTLATFAVTMTPTGIESRYPNFARYMRRYAGTARMRWSITDQSGASFFDCVVNDGRLLLRVRTAEGSMVPLSGPARPMPDSLTLRGDFTMRVRRFNVGFRNYHAEFRIIRTDHERTWSIVSRHEPQWVLPLVTERLLRTPLRRPFQGSGAFFRIGVRDDTAGGQTVLHRRMHLEVQESTILRFIGRLGSVAISEFSGRVEREEYAWLREVFNALVADVRALK